MRGLPICGLSSFEKHGHDDPDRFCFRRLLSNGQICPAVFLNHQLTLQRLESQRGESHCFIRSRAVGRKPII